jgi:hypothetical protein
VRDLTETFRFAHKLAFISAPWRADKLWAEAAQMSETGDKIRVEYRRRVAANWPASLPREPCRKSMI